MFDQIAEELAVQGAPKDTFTEVYADKTVALYQIAEQWCEKESVIYRKRQEKKS